MAYDSNTKLQEEMNNIINYFEGNNPPTEDLEIYKQMIRFNNKYSMNIKTAIKEVALVSVKYRAENGRRKFENFGKFKIL